MTAEPRDVEAAVYDDVYTELSLALGTDDTADEDVDFKRDLTARIMRHFAAADRENAELRGEVERLRRQVIDHAWTANDIDQSLRDRLSVVTKYRHERDDLRAQLAAAQAQLAKHRDAMVGHMHRAEAAEARVEAVLAACDAAASDPDESEWVLVSEIRAAALAAAPQPEHAENACRSCGIDNPVWFAPNEVWNAVMVDHTGFLCPRCFIVRAEASGMRPTAWVLAPEETQ